MKKLLVNAFFFLLVFNAAQVKAQETDSAAVIKSQQRIEGNLKEADKHQHKIDKRQKRIEKQQKRINRQERKRERKMRKVEREQSKLNQGS